MSIIFYIVPRNARDFRPVFCLYFCYWPAAARHPGFQPLSPPSNLHSPPVRLVPRRTLRGGSAGGGLVRLILPRHPKAAVVVLFIQSTYKNRLSCGVAPFSFKSTKEDPIVVVSVTPPPPPPPRARCSFGENNNKNNHATHPHV